jgi:site-specific recombinase XerD
MGHRGIRSTLEAVRISSELMCRSCRIRHDQHTYSALLRSTGAELKTMQGLLRHSTIRVTLDTYTQAVTTAKRSAQQAVVALLFPQKPPE